MVNSPSEEPAWKRRAVERSIPHRQGARGSAGAAVPGCRQAIITEKGSTDFTVKRWWIGPGSHCGASTCSSTVKHELLLALFEDALSRAADQIRAATSAKKDPLERLKVAVTLLFELSRPDPTARRPLFTDFARSY